jgi:hypothetical protein
VTVSLLSLNPPGSDVAAAPESRYPLFQHSLPRVCRSCRSPAPKLLVPLVSQSSGVNCWFAS